MTDQTDASTAPKLRLISLHRDDLGRWSAEYAPPDEGLHKLLTWITYRERFRKVGCDMRQFSIDLTHDDGPRICFVWSERPGDDGK